MTHMAGQGVVGSPELINPAVTFTGVATNSGSGTTLATGAIAAGAADASRWTIAAITIAHNTVAQIPTSVTINGIAATLLAEYQPATKTTTRLFFYYVYNPTGTTAVVSVTWASSHNRLGVALFRDIGNEPSAINVVKAFFSGSTDVSQAVVVPAGGIGLAVDSMSSGDASYHASTWSGTGVTEVCDSSTGGSNVVTCATCTASATVGVSNTADGGNEFLYIGLEPS